MPFPESPRVVYKRNPLDRVICQLRFPAILRIEAQPPAELQDKIRASFPIFRQQQSHSGLPPDLPDEVRQMIGGGQGIGSRAYNFATGDQLWIAALNASSISLESRAYTNWAGFREKLEVILAALEETYRPAFYERVGLRYIDVIRRTKLGLPATTPWSDLLQPHITGELGDVSISDYLVSTGCESIIRLAENEGYVRFRHATRSIESELCFVIDGDFFVEGQTQHESALTILDGFNRKAGRMFRWCITDTLRNALQPE